MKEESDLMYCSFSLRKVIEHLHLRNLKYTPKNAHIGYNDVNHGIMVALPDGLHHLTIQTHPTAVITSFCTIHLHTLVDSDDDASSKIGYNLEVECFDEPCDAFAFIDACIEKYK